MCCGLLTTLWSVRKLSELSVESLALLKLIKPAPGAALCVLELPCKVVLAEINVGVLQEHKGLQHCPPSQMDQ